MENIPEHIAKPLSPGQAAAEIAAMQAQMMQVGGVDSEKEAFEKILEKLIEGNIEPQEALNQAHGVINNRQEYR